jgi:NAD(P)-dependent dehydrogenase (short-subunit alcohol dehydrogenase family)
MRRVVITGGASGIGAASVARFQEDGCRVAALDRDEAMLATCGADVTRVCDVANDQSISAAIDEAVAELGGLDVIVTAAGIASRGSVVECTPEEFGRVMSVNVRGVYLVCRATIPHLRSAGGGAVVVVASQLGLVAVPDAAAYCASKGAAINLARAMALDHAAEGIRVNAVCPGPTDTPLVQRFFEESGDRAATQAAFEELTAIGRLIEPSEIAEAICFLASERAKATIGAALVVDAGYTAR